MNCNVSACRVNQDLTEGRVPGTERSGRSRAVSEDAEKPADPRKAKEQKR